jgi:hypothetical protein
MKTRFATGGDRGFWLASELVKSSLGDSVSATARDVATAKVQHG